MVADLGLCRIASLEGMQPDVARRGSASGFPEHTRNDQPPRPASLSHKEATTLITESHRILSRLGRNRGCRFDPRTPDRGELIPKITPNPCTGWRVRHPGLRRNTANSYRESTPSEKRTGARSYPRAGRDAVRVGLGMNPGKQPYGDASRRPGHTPLRRATPEQRAAFNDPVQREAARTRGAGAIAALSPSPPAGMDWENNPTAAYEAGSLTTAHVAKLRGAVDAAGGGSRARGALRAEGIGASASPRRRQRSTRPRPPPKARRQRPGHRSWAPVATGPSRASTTPGTRPLSGRTRSCPARRRPSRFCRWRARGVTSTGPSWYAALWWGGGVRRGCPGCLGAPVAGYCRCSARSRSRRSKSGRRLAQPGSRRSSLPSTGGVAPFCRDGVNAARHGEPRGEPGGDPLAGRVHRRFGA